MGTREKTEFVRHGLFVVPPSEGGKRHRALESRNKSGLPVTTNPTAELGKEAFPCDNGPGSERKRGYGPVVTRLLRAMGIPEESPGRLLCLTADRKGGTGPHHCPGRCASAVQNSEILLSLL